MKFDHVAVTVPTESMMKNNVKWYCDQYNAKVLYQDDTWSLLSVGGVKVAFVLPQQHPPHIAFRIDDTQRASLEEEGHEFKKHRDGSESCYIKDLCGNHLEFLFWPKKEKKS